LNSPPLLRTRLSIMMFLQYAIWGSWLPILFPFLTGWRHFSLGECGWILAGGAAGSLVGPFIAGQVADRFFATEKFLGVSHLAGAALVWFLAGTSDFGAFLALSVVYGIIYTPTLALTNSLTLHHLSNRDRDFGRVRLWGTIGWIGAGIAVGQWLLHKYTPLDASNAVVKLSQDEGRGDAFLLAAILGIAMGLYCFTLPSTPPTKNAVDRSAVAKALREVGRQPLITLFLLAIPVSCIHQFYFIYTSDFLSGYGRDMANDINRIFGVGGGGLMTIGQMSEIVVLAAIPLVAKQVSRKSLLGLGLAAFAARMALFAYAPTLTSVLVGVALHGLCFGCFIFVAYMVVDEETTPDVRASAQNLFNIMIVGVGIGFGSWISTAIVGKWATVTTLEEGKEVSSLDFTRLFSVPMWASLACLSLLILFYPGGRRLPAEADA
jgi:nucleoside transporter